MAAKKVYAVKKGRTPGVFSTWEQCKASVDGYPGADYKGFATRQEAEEYIGIASGGDVKAHPGQVVAYVDGSFDKSIGRYSFGCVILTPEGDIVKEFGNGNNPESLALRNVTGEMLGAMFAVQWCLKNGYSDVNIRYDYSGVEMWVTGAWKAKNERTREYAAYMQKNAHLIQISFQKIAAHTGDYYNEEADKLAKRGLTEGNGIPKVTVIREVPGVTG